MNKLIDILNQIDFDDKSSINDIFMNFSVSYFNHSLDDDEYAKESVICFSDVGDDSERKLKFHSIEARFSNLYGKLYEMSNCQVSLVLDGNVNEIIGFQEFLNALSLTMRENPLYNFYLNELGLYIMGGYDLTHEFYLLKKHAHFLPQIKTEISNAGLFYLRPE